MEAISWKILLAFVFKELLYGLIDTEVVEYVLPSFDDNSMLLSFNWFSVPPALPINLKMWNTQTHKHIHTHSITHSLSLSPTLSLSHSHPLFLSLTHTHSFSLSLTPTLSLSHSHPLFLSLFHIHTHTRMHELTHIKYIWRVWSRKRLSLRREGNIPSISTH